MLRWARGWRWEGEGEGEGVRGVKKNFDLTTELFKLIYHPKKNAKLAY